MKSPKPSARKQEDDQVETAKLIARGTPVARINTGIDGGMNRVFAAKVPGGNTGLSEGGTGLALLTLDKAPGTIPPTVNPPRGPVTSPEEPWRRPWRRRPASLGNARGVRDAEYAIPRYPV